MKLHLPKLLCVALMSVLALPVMGAGLTSDNIVTPVEGGASYLNVGMENTTDTWSGDLVVGDTAEAQGDVDNVGAFTDSWGWVTPNGGSNNTTITSGLKVNGSLTVQNGGMIKLGGQYNGGSSYTGLEATSGITVTGGSLTSTKIITTHLNVSGGTVSTNTSNCTGGNSYAGGAKQSYIKNSLTLSGGSLSFGYEANVQGIGGGKHRMTAFGDSNAFTMTQTGGTMKVYGDMDLRSGSTITQGEGAGLMSLRDTIYMGGTGTTIFNQSGDNAKLVLGRLVSTGNILSKPQCDFVFNQSGSGLIHLAYGSNLYKAGTITLNQTGAGTINIGGGHDTSITGSLPSRGYALTGFETINTTYTINQTGNGTITVHDNATIAVKGVVANGELNNNGTMNVTAGTVNKVNVNGLEASGIVTNNGTMNVSAATLSGTVTNNGTMNVSGELNQTAGTINVAANASMTASSVSVGGVFEVANGGVLNAGVITVTEGGTLINNGVITGSSAATLAADDELSLLNNDEMLIVIAGGVMENYGQTDKNILVQDGGALTLLDGASVGSVTMEQGGEVTINGTAVTGALTLTGGTVTFTEGATLQIADGTNVTISDAVSIVVNLSDASLNELKNGGTYTLFDTTSDMEFIDGSTMTFVGTNGDTITTTVNYAGEGAVELAPVVPEPTTATLSLLALAGLAARRRRK